MRRVTDLLPNVMWKISKIQNTTLEEFVVWTVQRLSSILELTVFFSTTQFLTCMILKYSRKLFTNAQECNWKISQQQTQEHVLLWRWEKLYKYITNDLIESYCLPGLAFFTEVLSKPQRKVFRFNCTPILPIDLNFWNQSKRSFVTTDKNYNPKETIFLLCLAVKTYLSRAPHLYMLNCLHSWMVIQILYNSTENPWR